MKVNKNTRRYLLHYINLVKHSLFFGTVMLIISTYCTIYTTDLIGKILDSDLVNADFGSVMKSVGVFLALTVAGCVMKYASSYMFNITANGAVRDIQNDLYEKVSSLSVSYFDKTESGKIVSRITNDTNALKTLFFTVLSQFVTAFVFIVVVLITVYRVDRNAALIMLIPFPLFIGAIYLYRKLNNEPIRKFREENAGVNSDINETIKGMEVIQAFNTEGEVMKIFEKRIAVVFKLLTRINIVDTALTFNAINAIKNFTYFGVLMYFGYSYLNGSGALTVGTLYVLIRYIGEIFGYLVGIMNRISQLEKALGASDKIFELMALDSYDEGGISELELDGEVEFKNVSFAYNDKDFILKDVSFKLKRNESMAIVGHTGSGKSSMMNLLFGFYRPQRGSVCFDGVNIVDADNRLLRKNMAMVLQEPYMFTGTIYTNISLFDESITREMATDALIKVGGRDILISKNGIDAEVKEGGNTFSQGEKQIISFARALVRNPKILVLDEATSSVDTETEQKIQRSLDILREGRTTFMIAHRLSTIKSCDRILVLDKGRVIERGTHDELIKLGGHYKKLVELSR